MPSFRSPLLRICCLSICLGLFVLSPAQSQSATPLPSTASNEAVRRLGQEFVVSDKSDALSMAIVRKGDVAFFDFGTTLHGGHVKPTKLSVYEIGSITKLFTSLLLAHASQEGKIDLHEDIRHYLPGEYKNLSFQGSPIRVIDLADTTSALPDNLPDFEKATGGVSPEQKAFVLAKILDRYSQADMLRDLHSITLAGKPGEEPRHSNLAAEVLGYILTRLYGEPFATLLRSRIQGPFGMANGVSADHPELVVPGYDAHHIAMPATNQPAVLAAGGLHYSAQDMAKFLQAELARGESAIPLTQRPAWGTVEQGAVGFHWQISRNVEGAIKLNASGGTLGGSSYIEIYPERGYGVVLLANRSGETESLLYGLADALFAATEGTPGLDALKSALEQSRYAHVESTVQQVLERFPQLTLSEAYVNQWGGGLLGTSPAAALALFAYNVQRWPRSSNAYDSLGEGYEQNGDKPKAIQAYRKALELDPKNKEASDSLALLLKERSGK